MTRETSNTFSVSVRQLLPGNSTTYAYTGVVMPGDGQNSARAFDDTSGPKRNDDRARRGTTTDPGMR